MIHSRRRRGRGMRGGAVLLVVIVVIGVSMTLVVAWVGLVANHQATVREGELQAQAVWVGDAALSRAVAERAMDEKYRGETWRPKLDGLHAWSAEIAVAPAEGERLKVTIKIIADEESERALTRTIERTLAPPKRSDPAGEGKGT